MEVIRRMESSLSVRSGICIMYTSPKPRVLLRIACTLFGERTWPRVEVVEGLGLEDDDAIDEGKRRSLRRRKHRASTPSTITVNKGFIIFW